VTESRVHCPYCTRRLPVNLGPGTAAELRPETDRHPIEPGEVFVVCERCDQRWIMRVVALAT